MYASHVSLFMQSATLQHAMSSFFFFYVHATWFEIKCRAL